MDIKLIQHDTLGYLFLNDFMRSGNYQKAKYFIDACIKCYNSNQKDIYEYLINSYLNGAYTRIEEVVRLEHRLQNSLQYISTYAEKSYLDLMYNCKNYETFTDFIEKIIKLFKNKKFNEIVWGRIFDNRHLSIVYSNNRRIENDLKNVRKKTFDDEIICTELRLEILKILSIGHYLTQKLIKNRDGSLDRDTMYDVENFTVQSFADSLDYLKKLSDQCLAKSKEKTKFYLAGPVPSRLSFSFCCHFNLVRFLLHSLLSLLRYNQEIDGKNEEKYVQEGPQNICESMIQSLNDLNALINDFGLRKAYKLFNEFDAIVEIVSISISLYGLINQIIQTKLNRRPKKKPNDFKEFDPNISKIIESSSVIGELLKQTLNLLSGLIDSTSNACKNLIFKEDFIYFPHLKHSKSLNQFKQNIIASYLSSLACFNEVIQIKFKYLKAIAQLTDKTSD
ncbi:hypothetical protein SSS_04909 [Sarcoptes scabiei]|nr:hypothetical protein SSS_04909 [Sarcoptes scabiei]